MIFFFKLPRLKTFCVLSFAWNLLLSIMIIKLPNFQFLEIKKELLDLGYKFKSKGDTEVILAAYKQWGEKCQLKFNGMWAFAIYDKEKRIMFLSRDRFGEKPLFYTLQNNLKLFLTKIYF